MHKSYLYNVTHVHTLVGCVSQILLQTFNHAGLNFQAGQYVNVIHHDKSDSPLSIACAPNRIQQLEFHLFHPPQNLQAQDLLRMANQEKVWTVQGPFGDCTDSNLNKHKPIIFIARGTGFASIKSIIESLSQLPHPQSMHLFWSMPDASEFYMEKLLAEWKVNIAGFQFTSISTDTKSAHAEFLCQAIIQQYKNISDHQIYASGSPLFVKMVYDGLLNYGLQKEFFYSDVM